MKRKETISIVPAVLPPPVAVRRQTIVLDFDPVSMPLLQRLPWHKPLGAWTKKDAPFIQVKSGLSRHIVRFISIRGQAFAIKETNAHIARKEMLAYERLQRLGIPTLHPVGVAVREDGYVATETPSGTSFEKDSVGYLVTSLLEYSLPNYHLFKRAFTRENRRRIWDAIVRLFVQLHLARVYWGDASLSNMMILFAKEYFPEIGLRTVLRAVLADAETVEFPTLLSEQLRLADIEYFLETMRWTEADMQASGMIRETLMTDEDQEYILQRYKDLFEIEREEHSFEVITKIDVDALLGPFEVRGQSKALLQHIYEHKWYLSEQAKKEVPVEAAAQDWYVNVFKPALRLFADFEILEEFPESTASSLYLDIMLQKYYLSEEQGRDVGLVTAFEEYAKRFAYTERARKKLSTLARSVRMLFSGRNM